MNNARLTDLYSRIAGHNSTPALRILFIVAMAVGAHAVVWLIKVVSEWITTKVRTGSATLGFVAHRPKVITIHRLIVSGLIFMIYFLAFGMILRELGVNLTTYLASASVIGLAISFGSQGLVQDIVSGLTLILLDTMDVGDMVEIVGAATVVGLVQEIGLRYTTVTNFYNQEVLVPNRTIANVSRFANGGVDAYADVWIPEGADRLQILEVLKGLSQGLQLQFSAIILKEPQIAPPLTPAGAKWAYSRIHFKIWPNQGSLIETTFRQEVVKAMKAFDPDYAEWQVPVTYR